MNVISVLRKLFFPDVCVFCVKYSKNDICASCRGKILQAGVIQSENYLYRYGKFYCYGKYVGILRQRFIDFKFKHEMWIGRRFGALMYDYFKRELAAEKVDAVTFVPISDSRYCERGFNQSKEMAQEIAKLLGIKCICTLECLSDGATQSKLRREMRIKKVQGRFRVNNRASKLIGGKRLLIIDDIFTTGSTLNECAALLKDAGADVVDAMVFASGRGDIN